MRIRVWTNDELKIKCPSLFCQRQAEYLSEQYQFCPTEPTIKALQAQGWHVIDARQQGRLDTSKHLIRMIQGTPDLYNRIELTQDETFTLALVGSHDGTRALRGIGGILVRACLNGLLVAQNTLGSFKFVHRTCNADKINDALTYFKVNFNGIQDMISKMKNTQLNDMDMQNLAIKSIVLRWGELNAAPKTVTSLAVLQSHRHSDNGNTLWQVFNRIQENLMTHKIKNVKGIRDVNEDVRINQALWDMAVSLIK